MFSLGSGFRSLCSLSGLQPGPGHYYFLSLSLSPIYLSLIYLSIDPSTCLSIDIVVYVCSFWLSHSISLSLRPASARAHAPSQYRSLRSLAYLASQGLVSIIIVVAIDVEESILQDCYCRIRGVGFWGFGIEVSRGLGA